MPFTILRNKRFEPSDRFTLFANPYEVKAPHGDFTSITMWSSVEPDGSTKPSSQYFKSFRASDDLIRSNPDFFMIECECGNKHLEDECEECCNHEYDPDEGMMCINCGEEYPY